MEKQNSLRAEIKKAILSESTNFAEFSRRSGVNRGVFSLILNPSSPKPISLNQLETIGKALDKESGWLFELFVEECFFNGKPNRRRVEPFLIRCTELGRTDCIHQVLSRLKEDSKYVDMVFEISEALYLSGKNIDALNFYEFVVQNATVIHAEKLAVSHYRIFRSSIGEEHEKNLRTLLRFEPYCKDLPVHYRLDALMKLIDLHFSFAEWDDSDDRWKHVEYYSKKLFLLADQVYESIKTHQKTRKESLQLPLEKPLVVYYGYSFLSLGNIMLNREKFTQAYTYIAMYEDLSWFEVLDESAKVQIARFTMYAHINWNSLELMEGKEEAIEQCMDLIEAYPEATLSSWVNLLSAANRYGFNIKAHVEDLFKKIEEQGLPFTAITTQNEIVKNRYYLEFYYEQSLYYLNEHERDKALTSIKKAVQIADQINRFDNKKVHQLLFELLKS